MGISRFAEVTIEQPVDGAAYPVEDPHPGIAAKISGLRDHKPDILRSSIVFCFHLYS